MANEIAVPDLTLALGIEVADLVLIDDLFDWSMKKDGHSFVFTHTEKPRQKLSFDGRQMLDVRDGPAGVFVAKDVKGNEHMLHFYGSISRHEARRLNINDYIDNTEEVDANPPPQPTDEEQAQRYWAARDAYEAEKNEPFDQDRWNKEINRMLTENAELMEKHVLARNPGKRVKPVRKG